MWPHREMLLWDPGSPGGRASVQVRFPRYLWVKGPDSGGTPHSFATLGEVGRMYREQGIGAPRWWQFAEKRARRAAHNDRDSECRYWWGDRSGSAVGVMNERCKVCRGEQ